MFDPTIFPLKTNPFTRGSIQFGGIDVSSPSIHTTRSRASLEIQFGLDDEGRWRLGVKGSHPRICNKDRSSRDDVIQLFENIKSFIGWGHKKNAPLLQRCRIHSF